VSSRVLSALLLTAAVVFFIISLLIGFDVIESNDALAWSALGLACWAGAVLIGVIEGWPRTPPR